MRTVVRSSPAYRVITTDNQGRYEIEKRIYTDPDQQSLVVRDNDQGDERRDHALPPA